MAVFTPGYREHLRSELVEAARADGRIMGAAITGSASVGLDDRWSDIDLAFGLKDASELPKALADWTDLMFSRHEAVHHLDVWSGATVYRVFLLRNTLQVDLAFSPRDEFAARGPTFRLLFGESAEARRLPPPPKVEELIGLSWLYALHARACLKRGQLWRAEYMVSSIRGNTLTLACVRHGLPTSHARGVDRLPTEVTAPLEEALIRKLQPDEMSRAFKAAVKALLVEIRVVDADLSERIEPTLKELADLSP